ncbi:sulfite exporter TauE/SafE family protein [Sedimentimonas flavescens]|uniref:Probable membrane transporter protein n=1 Tax=Sedimentimonas flavescens TaxID=2851012 RepID=A0ABT2ZUJ4_9RHOB|nr:sulfite exporter TauE/SafE family protein [Sedimentimonas flavescens]MCT2539306.1 sulfite exporter TauE/SafE family protein [Sedimentimonas flavescens]MCV2877413.1 sulfite exporter TauE/SafE family protein [Sedimentimonas flavescens]WBL34680.1 sulfite exporter TauE/SafE family protein [Sinirhodobacter sp. HNIBRBA609]
MDSWGWAMAVLAAISVGMAKGGLPMVSSLSVPLLAGVMNPVAAAGLLLPVYIVSDMFGLIAYRKEFDKRVLKIMVPATAIGVGIGWATASYVPERVSTGLVGLIGVVFALNAILRPRLGAAAEPKVGPGMFWGAITGFTSFISHSGAPPYQAYTIPLNLPRTVFAGTSTILFAWVNAIKLIPYAALGQLNLGSLKLALVLAIPAAVSVFLGVRLVRIIPHEMFYKLVTWALLLISAKLLWGAILA